MAPAGVPSHAARQHRSGELVSRAIVDRLVGAIRQTPAASSTAPAGEQPAASARTKRPDAKLKQHDTKGTATGASEASHGAKTLKDPELTKPPKGASVSKDEETTVVTINVKAFQLSDGGNADQRAFDAIEQYIEDVDADVVLFQELDVGTTRSGGSGVDQLAEFAKRVDADDHEFAKAIEHQDGEYGVGILTRNGYEISDDAAGKNKTQTVQLPKTPTEDGGDKEQRVALVAAIETPGGNEFSAITTHLSTKGPGRGAQIDKLDDIVQDLQDGAGSDGAGLADDMPTEVVLGGDFNTKRGPAEEHLGDEVTHVADLDKDLGGTGIDHLYVTDGVSVVDAQLDEAETVEGHWLPFGWKDVKSTDHPAVRATIRHDG